MGVTQLKNYYISLKVLKYYVNIILLKQVELVLIQDVFLQIDHVVLTKNTAFQGLFYVILFNSDFYLVIKKLFGKNIFNCLSSSVGRAVD